MLHCNDSKKKKYAFKAATVEETKLWVIAINKFTNNINEDALKESESDDSDQLEKNVKHRRRN